MDVKLVTWTSQPVETIAWAFANMHNPIENNLNAFVDAQIEKCGSSDKWEKVKDELIEMMAVNPHSSVLEFVNTVWYIGGCSRAFQQQLTRTREAAYSIQSLRIVDVKKFATRGDYQTGPTVRNNSDAEAVYNATMMFLEAQYADLVDHGVKTEDARGILPLNINSPITMSINLRRLQHLLEARLCYLAQGEYRSVGLAMIDEIVTKMDKRFGNLFSKPCDKLKFCPMPVNCGKTQYKMNEAYQGKNIEHWLKG